ncbi:family 78 glycoside hydrolase catalytic domain [Parapedobacter sp. 10938]|uniref:family 78 glycoside hydrolase catalytic domain n=1 Tax=Parapedobacter flavus TaxID=3110225 RepID=UPI002DB79F60|nr:family 78 glycoside hydrolase catalytic domain [Parapedobacter sp. 10938]MEC3880470.1 family 78 glycoside hydrolase catalytic domain [Parapedobacter sp. 10938]
MLPINLRSEYLDNSVGITIQSPRLSWVLEATDKGDFAQRQTAYRVLVSSTARLLTKEHGDVWDSGWVKSDETQHITYHGKELRSDRTYHWKVQVKDEQGRVSAWSNPAYWTTGLFNASEWTAEWIGSGELYDRAASENNITDPWFRKTVELRKKPGKATIFVASVGYHELYVNGERIGDEVLAPAVTDHTKRARYVAYDIADKLKRGTNVIALWLGTSWSIFPGYILHEDRPLTPIVSAQMEVYEDVSPADNAQPLIRMITDSSWKTHPSPNRLLGKWDFRNMGGEIWDARKEIADWNKVTCDETTWRPATEYTPNLTLSPQLVAGNRLFDEITPVSIEERADGSFRVDMGVNFAGWTEVEVKGQEGDTIRFQYSEREQDDMTFNLHSAYVIGATGKGTFRNRFNYSSGRWITIQGLDEAPDINDIRGWMVRTDYENAAQFESSDTLQNWIYDRVRWTFENLSLGGFIVDCPQRERMGYGGDAHATSETGMFNYHLGAFYTKWMQDWRDVQGTEPMVGNMLDTNYARKAVTSGRLFHNGVLPHTAPTYWGGGGPAWGGIVVTLPWFMYQHYGDKLVLENNFELIQGWLAFLKSHTKDNLLQRFGGQWDFLGDWLWPNATAEGMNNDKPETLCLNNAYYVFNLRTAAKIARVTGHGAEASEWEAQAEASAKAVHARFFNAADHSYADGSMANLAAALLADIPPASLRSEVMQRLEKEILDVRDGHIHAGITGGALLFKLLRNEGRDDLIYSMVSQTTYPSWGYMKANDATTLWEMWEKDLPGHSLLHSSYLYPGAWYIDGVAGIKRDPEHPGFKQFIIRPALPGATEVKWANASFESPVGTIRSNWSRRGGQLALEMTVPPNSVAWLQLATDEAVDISAYPSIEKPTEQNGLLQYKVLPGTYQLKQIAP